MHNCSVHISGSTVQMIDNSSNNSKLVSYVRKTELRTLVLVLLVHPPGEFSHCAPKSPKLFRKYDLENGHMDREASHRCTIIDNLSDPHGWGRGRNWFKVDQLVMQTGHAFLRFFFWSA